MSASTAVAVFHKFCSNLPSSKYIFKSGKVATFVCGQFLTKIESEIAELQAEVDAGHPHIFVKAGESTVDSEKADPLAAIKKKAVEEHLAAQARAANPDNDMGNTASAPGLNVGAANSKSLAGVAVAVSGGKQ